ncbi:hypothetical protein ACS0TY_008034 [Phlomoides rotata]
MSYKQVSYSLGYVRGPHGQESLVCQYFGMINSHGSMWFGGDPFAFSVPLVLGQFIVIFIITSIISFLLKPCKQGAISAQLIGGIILGQSFLGHVDSFREKIFPPWGRQILETCADIGFMFYLFILGVHIDVSLVKRIERYSVVIGTLCFMVPLIIGIISVSIISNSIEIDPSVRKSLPFVATLSAVSSFPVITTLLNDLNILNSEIGRLATLASLVSDICNYALSLFIGSLVVYVVSQRLTAISSIAGALLLFFIIFFIFRTIIVCISNRVPEGQRMREVHFVIITVIVLLCGLGAEVLGQPAALGTFLLGIVVPEGPPLGTSYVNKLDTITMELLVPAKFVISGLSMNIFSVKGISGAACVLVIFICYAAKFTGVLIPSLYYKIPMKDAVTLALIMCCRGSIEATYYITLHEEGILGREAYALLLTSMLIVTGISRPLIARLYDPSERYVGQCKNSIMLNHPNDELRMLVCIHNADNVPSIINLLEASAPMKNQPIAVFVLSLMELKGRAASVLESTGKNKFLTTTRSWSKHAVNAFDSFAHRYLGSVVVRHFTSIAPYASMHDDICTLAADQVTNIVIVPFHKQWGIDGNVGAPSPSIRMVNQNVMTKAPCSVAILIDRGQVNTAQFIVRGRPMFHICLLFLGGMDDCEALAYCTRFIMNHEISLTFIWIREWGDDGVVETELVNKFRARTIGDERITYKEERVKDSIGTTRVINSLKDYGFDLCVVGRYHDPISPLLMGFNDWSECPELGLVGDILATSDFDFSVLVVQQEPQGGEVGSLQPFESTYLSSARYTDLLDNNSSYSLPRI